MTKRELARAYIAKVLPLLNLKQWDVKVSESLPPDDAYADIEVSENLWSATIRLSEDFWKEKQRASAASSRMNLFMYTMLVLSVYSIRLSRRSEVWSLTF